MLIIVSGQVFDTTEGADSIHAVLLKRRVNNDDSDDFLMKHRV